MASQATDGIRTGSTSAPHAEDDSRYLAINLAKLTTAMKAFTELGIADILAKGKGPMSAEEIVAKLPTKSVTGAAAWNLKRLLRPLVQEGVLSEVLNAEKKTVYGLTEISKWFTSGIEFSTLPRTQAVETKGDINACWKEDSLPQIKEAEEGNSSNPLLLDPERASAEHQFSFLFSQFQGLKDLIVDICSHIGKVVYREGHAIRLHIDEGNQKLLVNADEVRDDVLSKIRSHLGTVVYREGHAIRQHIDEGNQKLLVNADEGRDEVLLRILAHYSFSIAEKEKSVPRFLILKRKDCSGYWTGFKDTIKSTFRKDYRLHFPCECQFDDGKLHWVENQEGVKLSKTTVAKEWLKEVEPWVRWSYLVATTVARIVLTVLVPGTAGAIPTISSSTEEHDRARDTAVKMLHDEDIKNYHGNPGPAEQLTGVTERLIAEGHGNVGTSDQPTDVKMKLIAESVVKDLISDIGISKFVEGTKLRRVLLKATPQSECSRRSRPADSIVWVCDKCLEKYGAEVTVINP